MVDLGDRLKALRAAKKLSQTQVAQRVGVSKSMISSYELSNRMPSYDVLIKLTGVFGVSTDYLLGLERSRTLNVDKLNETQIAIIHALINEMRCDS